MAEMRSRTAALRVVLAEDHPVTMLGVLEILRTDPALQVIAAVTTSDELSLVCRRERPDVAVVDLMLADGPALPAIERALAERPELAVLVLTGRHTEEQAFRALRAGARGYLTKSTPPAQLLEAVSAVARGRRVVAHEVAADVEAREAQPELTARELDVLRLLCDGRMNAEIGVALGISTGTVRTHVSQILAKLGVADRTEAATAALRRGIV